MEGHVKSTLKAASVRSHLGWLDRYLRPRFGKLELGKITRGDVRDFSHEMRDKGIRADKVSASSVKTAIIVLSSLLNHAIEDGLIEKNPAERPGRYIKVPHRRGIVEFLNPDEAETILETTRKMSPRLYPLVLAALRTGMRQGGTDRPPMGRCGLSWSLHRSPENELQRAHFHAEERTGPVRGYVGPAPRGPHGPQEKTGGGIL